jgi:hypothetical protein
MAASDVGNLCDAGARRPVGPIQMKRPGAYARSLRTPGLFDYFNEVLTELKVELSPDPIPFTVAMIAIAIPTAMRPYSMAVAPDSSLKNVESIAFMWLLPRLDFPLEPVFSPVSTSTEENLRLFEGEKHKFSGYCAATTPLILLKSDRSRCTDAEDHDCRLISATAIA